MKPHHFAVLTIALLTASRANAEDHRLDPPKDLNGYFPFEVSESVTAWEKRATQLRLQMRVALGIHPEPERTPLNAVIHGEIDRGEYTVAKVYFESLPGFFVTGNLYRPKGATGKIPGVLSPHGHVAEGRFSDEGEAEALAKIQRGEEQFPEGGRSKVQSRAVGLARLGCVVFHYDMIGYADSTQLSFDLAHKHAKGRLAMNTSEDWGLYSAQAEAHLQSIMGLQTWNSIRALDFITSLEQVDPQRIAVTGGSGGGTQSMILAALDPRVAASFPAVMVSTAMQGGCTCENATLLRIGTGNVEFAALFAPKPQGMSTADDWTKEMATKGFPQLQAHYKMLGKPQNVMLHDRTEFKHNYNQPTRLAMYQWFNQHLKLGQKEPIAERDYQRLTRDEMTVWNDEHPSPPRGEKFERKLLQTWKKSTQIAPEQAREGFHAIFQRDIHTAGEVEFQHRAEKLDRGDFIQMEGNLHNKTYTEQVAITFLYPKAWNGEVVICTDALQQADATRLIKSGRAIATVKPLLPNATENRHVENPREFAGYTYGYNHPLLVQRTHDLLTTIRFIKDDSHGAKKISLLAHAMHSPAAVAARMLAGDSLDQAAIDIGDFSFAKLLNYRDPNFLPGGSKYGDIAMMIRLGQAPLQTDPTKIVDSLLAD